MKKIYSDNCIAHAWMNDLFNTGFIPTKVNAVLFVASIAIGIVGLFI